MIRLFRLFLYLVFGLLLGGLSTFAFAGYAQLKAPSNLGGSVGARTTSGAVSVSSGAISAGYTINVAGQTVTMPASMRFAANAGQIAVTALRGSPSVLIGTAVLAWLAQKGLDYVDGQFVKQGEVSSSPDLTGVWSNGLTNRANGGLPYAGPLSGALALALETLATDNCGGSHSNTFYCPEVSQYTCQIAGETIATCTSTSNYTNLNFSSSITPTCPAGTTLNGTQCVGLAVPAGQADWDAVAASPFPDAVAEELAGKGVPLPLESPQFNPLPKSVPLSDPYPKPNGQPNETVRDVAKVTPAPGETAKIETGTEPVMDENGDPVTDPATTPVPAEEKDFCVEHPTALACWDEGEVQDTQLEKSNLGQSITPVTIGGSGVCPPDKHVNYMGANLTLSFSPICMMAGWINPIVLALAWLAAGYILIGAFKE